MPTQNIFSALGFFFSFLKLFLAFYFQLHFVTHPRCAHLHRLILDFFDWPIDQSWNLCDRICTCMWPRHCAMQYSTLWEILEMQSCVSFVVFVVCCYGSVWWQLQRWPCNCIADINECSAGQDNCGHGQYCANNQGSFSCPGLVSVVFHISIYIYYFYFLLLCFRWCYLVVLICCA